ncbi:helix-turn-helix domain-containing protein [Brachybacterium sp. p3-SID1565]|uniref:IclR family transcriptional regulator n=1 Tax=Brachybacterium sp. p3-SID1565 TaxID=2916046 RepID=UPI0021A47DC8|nr:IclR family transcriptional regulator C-terminal domain-containing protein [Brachybacterium sp. p3-SID1565]MCT1384395.1 helix-turn-helix domain-containing protein [Brachybacterium sp. p3-SID1565]
MDQRATGTAAVLRLLDALVARADSSWGVRELSESTGLSRSTANRTLQALASFDLAQQWDDERYALGPRMEVLGHELWRSHPALAAADGALDRARRQIGGTVFLSVEDRGGRTCTVLSSREATSPLRYVIRPGTTLPTHAGAAGLAILSQLPEEQWSFDAERPTERTLEVPARAALLGEARRQGYVVSVGQNFPDAAGVAVALELAPGVTASVSRSRPSWDFEDADVPEIVASLRKAAEAIARAGGGPHPDASASAPRAARTHIDKVVALLEMLVRTPTVPVTHARLKEQGVGRVACASLLSAAQESGLVIEGGGGWLPGPTLFRWVARAGRSLVPEVLSRPVLRALESETHETAGLSLIGDDGVLTTRASITSRRTVQYVLPLGEPVPLEVGAIGKAVLAFRPELLSSPRPGGAGEERRAVPGPLEQELAEIRERGYAVAEGERIPQAYGVAAPVRINGIVQGSVGLTIPRSRVDRSRSTDYGDLVRAAAARLSALLTV